MSFTLLAQQRYPFTEDREHNQYMSQMRAEYIAALRECKAQPAYTLITPWCEYPCASEPLMSDDTKGWIKVKYTRQKKRRQRNIDDYNDY